MLTPFRPLPVCCLLLAALPLVAQTTGNNSVLQLRAVLLRQGPVTVAVTGLHVATRVLVRPIDNRVVNGTVQSRGMVSVLRGSDDQVLQPGTAVRVVAVESTSDAKNDILRLTVATPTGAQAPIAFVLPSGALASLSEPQLEQTVVPILRLPSHPSRAADSASTDRPSAQAAPAGWVVQPFAFGQEAHITGTAQIGGRRVPALLALRCFNKDATSENGFGQPTAGTPLLQLRIHRTDLTYDISSLGEKDGDDNAMMHIRIGSSPEQTVDLSTFSTNSDKASAAALVPDLRTPELQQIVQTPGITLRLTLSSPDMPPASTIEAQFTLPADGSPAQGVMNACLSHAEAQDASLRASRPVACPTRPGLVLVEGTVRYASTGKPLAVEPDRDQGVGWTLPKSTRTHPTPPRLNLVCGYAPPNPAPVSANTGAAARKAIESVTLPIPANLAGGTCETWLRIADMRSESYCTVPRPPGSER